MSTCSHKTMVLFCDLSSDYRGEGAWVRRHNAVSTG